MKEEGFDTVIVGDLREGDESLRAMIKDFTALYPYKTRFVNIGDFDFKGGCLGCFGCTASGKCVYKDGFYSLLRNSIQNADATVYAFTIRDHSRGSRFQMFVDRQFCNGHRTLTEGKSVAYIVNGDYQQEENLRTLLEARAQVAHNFLAGAGWDLPSMEAAAKRLSYALEHKYVQPRNFYGVGGMKIFRDLIYVMRGMMKADHKFYKEHGIYDFPQKQKKRILQMKLVGAMLAVPSVQKKMKGQMNQYIIGPYQKVVEQARESAGSAKQS